MEPLREKVVLELDASSVKGNSLAGLIQQLEQVELYVNKVNAAMAGFRGGARRSVRELEAEIKALQTKMGTGLKVSDLSRGLGFDEGAFRGFLARMKSHVKDYKVTMEEFRSAHAAATAVAKFQGEGRAGRASLQELLQPRVSNVTPGAASIAGGSFTAKVEGTIPLLIPAAQVQASVVGSIPVAGGPPRSPTGQFLPGAGGGGGGGAKSGKAALAIGGTPGELQRVRTETEKYLHEAVTAVDAAGQIITTTHDSVEGIIKTQTKRTTGQSPLAAYREARKIAEENFKQMKAALDPNDPGFGLAKVFEKQASQLQAIKSAPFMQSLGAVQRKEVERLLDEQVKTLTSRGAAAQVTAQGRVQEEVRQRYNRVLLANEKALEQRTQRAVKEAAKAGDISQPPPMPPILAPPKLKRAQMSIAEREGISERNRIERGARSFTPQGMLANFMNVSGWAAAVTILYKGFELAEHSLSRFLEIGRQTALLGQVFRGVGGTVQELTDDMLRLSAAQGRDTEEGMESAKEWSRLGLTRKEVNEAVRVSMMAANVAEMHTGETTKQLSSLMHVYGLEVGQLAGVLGMLTSTSQRYNVTLEDLFQGLDRSAGVARQAGMSLAELQGIIGAVVGKTGQSGIVVGNTIKSILVNFNNPEMQKFLRGFRIETTTAGGAQKSGSQVLREMFVEYQRLNDTERQNLTMRVAGRLQAARFVAMMENYVQAQKLAIDSQLQLNSAQEANAKILGTIKAQLAGVRAEWDRYVRVALTGGTGKPDEGISGQLGPALRVGKNLLRLGTNTLPLTMLVQRYLMGGMGQPEHNNWGVLLDWFNQQMETPLERGKAKFMNAAQARGSAAAGYLQQRDLFQTVADALGGARPERRMDLAGLVSGYLGPHADTLKGLVASGDIKGARALLGRAGEGAYRRALSEKMEQSKLQMGRWVEASAQMQTANATIAQIETVPETERTATAVERLAQAKEKLAEAQREMNEAQAGAQDAALYAMQEEDQYGMTEQAISRRQEYVNLLREQQQVMEVLGQLASQQTMDFASSRNEAAVEALRGQQTQLEAAANVAREDQSPAGVNTWQELQRQLAEVRAELAARTSPRTEAMLESVDRRSIAARRAGQEADTAFVGRTEGERLLRGEAFLKRELDRSAFKASSAGMNENDAVRAKEFEIRLWHTQEQIQTRILELTRQEKQIRIDANREFNKNLLLAGPGEQLQRLYVRSLLSRPGGLGAGEFNALGPEAKRMYYEALGGEPGALAREELGLLGGRSQAVPQEQEAAAEARRRAGGWGNVLSGMTGDQLGQFPPTLSLPPKMEDAAKRASEHLASVAKAAAAVATTFEMVNGQLGLFMKLIMGGTTVKDMKVGPMLDVSPGFSLGSLGSALLTNGGPMLGR